MAGRKTGDRFPKPVVIDTDPGLDDALALALALRSPALDIRAITVVAGNVPLAACMSNTLRILEAVGPQATPPVFAGHACPLSGKVARAGHVHGHDGLGGITPRYPVRKLAVAEGHASQAMAGLARQHGSDLTVIALGPLTNVAKAIERDPEAMSGIGRLVVMGGTDDGKGNVTPRAEFNFYSDAAAARIVVRAGIPATLVGLNVTRKTLLRR
ncbi:MAG: nucleoside hydrolase, partial [Bryobacterales bacterium]|nr:nucleoside hydrolase [Bryobacterales bacterium]